MLNLNKIINEALEKIEEEGLTQQQIQQELERTITEVISDILYPDSPFGVAIKQAIKSKLKINLDELNLDSANTTINSEIEAIINDKLNNGGLTKLKEQIDELLELEDEAEERYTLTEVMQQFKQYIDDNNY